MTDVSTAGPPRAVTLAAPQAAEQVPARIDELLQQAVRAGASDLHLVPAGDALDLSWRLDGVLTAVSRWPATLAPNVISRLKVLAELLTYRTDVPQEGRLAVSIPGVEMRLSTFPTLHGEKAVVRLFVGSGEYRFLEDLQLPEATAGELRRLLDETSGAIVFAGPAGSGKTTTAYACLRELQRAHQGGKSLVTLEDPIEAELPGVAQSQVNRPPEFDYPTGLRSLMRQDPDVILVGEIRDRATAETVFQACLTGHLVLTTFHAGSAAEAVSRLGDLGVEPYLLRTGLRGLVAQRLLRRLCDCATWTAAEEQRLGLPVSRVRVPVGCSACWRTGYQGRVLLAEILGVEAPEVGRAILERRDAESLHAIAVAHGLVSLGKQACAAVEAGQTSPAEVRRVLGFRRDLR